MALRAWARVCRAPCSAASLLPTGLRAVAPCSTGKPVPLSSHAHTSFPSAPAQVHKEALGAPEQEGYTCILPRQPAASHSSRGGSDGSAAAADVEVQRGYGPAEVHATPAEACQLMTRRSAGAWAIPESDHVAALRVSGGVQALRPQRWFKHSLMLCYAVQGAMQLCKQCCCVKLPPPGGPLVYNLTHMYSF